jgi:hypothetical protein
MSGIDNPIKKLKPIPAKDAHAARALANQIRETERLREIENARKKEDHEIKKIVSKLREVFAKEFEGHKARYLNSDTDNSVFQFVTTPFEFRTNDSLMKKASPVFLA